VAAQVRTFRAGALPLPFEAINELANSINEKGDAINRTSRIADSEHCRIASVSRKAIKQSNVRSLAGRSAAARDDIPSAPRYHPTTQLEHEEAAL
jgi:hypothetical protein